MKSRSEQSKEQLLAKIAELEARNTQLQNELNISRLREDSIPEGELTDPELADIIDVAEQQALMDNFYKLTHIPTAIIDLKGNVLVGAGWQNICTKYHRVHPETCKNCIESDTELTTGIPEGEFKLYKCKNGMWDLATPIIIGSMHMGNLFMGQFFFDSEPLDYDFFRSSARKFGFDEKEYISALEMVPRLNTADLDSAKSFFTRLAHSISELSYSNIKLTRLLNERNTLLDTLRGNEERFRSMFEKPKAVMLLIDPVTGQIIDANNAASEFYGWSRAELCTKKIQEINLLTEDEVALEREKALHEKRHHFVFRHRLADNDIRWVEVYSSPLIIHGKQLLFSVIHDITERKRAEDQLRKLSLAVEHSPDSIVITDTKGTIEYVNPMFTKITGFTSEEALGKNPRIMKSGRTNPVIYKRMWSVIKSGLQWRGAFENKKKSGELFWESVNISPVLNEHGEITNFVAIKEDITERIKHEEQLHKLNRTLRAIRHVGDAIIRATDEESYLHDICSIIVEDCGYSLVWIGFAMFDEARSVKPMASAGFEEGYLQTLNVSWADTEYGRGPTGTAIRTGEISFCRDLLNDPQFLPWREEAIKRGYASSIVLPIKTENKTIGSISIYARESNAFSSDETEMLTELAEDVSYGLAVIRLREANALAETELKNHRDNLEHLIKLRTSELEIANEILNEAQHVAHLGHWKLDFINNTLSWSDEIYRIFGIEPQQFGATLEAFLGFVHPDDRKLVENSFNESLQNKTSYNIDHRIVRPDGEVRIVHEECITHYDEYGKPVHSIGVVQDVTDLKKAQQELEHHKNNLEELVRTRTEELALANRQLQFEIEKEKQVELLLQESLNKEKDLNELKSRFISTTSHEFRTPLTAILSSVQLIQRYRKKWTDDKLEEQFAHIKNSIVNLTKLLDDILTISHADSGRIVFNPKCMDLNALCLEIMEDVKHKAGENHNFLFSYISDQKQFMIDPKLIRFIVMNLLSNAFKYSPAGGKVTFKVSSSSDYMQFSVTDEGIGIPKEAKEHLFRPFYRAENTGEIEGTGLGLSIVQRAVELHKGTIVYTSDPGKGTQFIVQIPIGG